MLRVRSEAHGLKPRHRALSLKRAVDRCAGRTVLRSVYMNAIPMEDLTRVLAYFRRSITFQRTRIDRSWLGWRLFSWKARRGRHRPARSVVAGGAGRQSGVSDPLRTGRGSGFAPQRGVAHAPSGIRRSRFTGGADGTERRPTEHDHGVYIQPLQRMTYVVEVLLGRDGIG